MKKILIATHGYLANGFKSSLEILAGTSNYIKTINAYTEECPGDYEDQILEFLQSIGQEDEGVIFTDLMSGSVNQKVCKVCVEHNYDISVVTDTNLMSILATLLECRPISKEVLTEVTEMTSVTLVPFVKKEIDENDFLS